MQGGEEALTLLCRNSACGSEPWACFVTDFFVMRSIFFISMLVIYTRSSKIAQHSALYMRLIP